MEKATKLVVQFPFDGINFYSLSLVRDGKEWTQSVTHSLTTGWEEKRFW